MIANNISLVNKNKAYKKNSFPFKKRIGIIIFCIGLITALIFFTFWIQQIGDLTNKKVIVRSVSIALPPPANKVVQKQVEQTNETIVDLNVQGSGAIFQFSNKQLSKMMNVEPVEAPKLSHSTPSWNHQLRVDWQAFGLNELDETPRLLTDLKIKFPRSLQRQGVHSANIELSVMIDETGKVLLKSIVNNSYPEMVPLIKNLIAKARFTAPKKEGVPVRATFNWPLEFSDS